MNNTLQQGDFSKEFLKQQEIKGEVIPSSNLYKDIRDQRLTFNDWQLNLPNYAFYPDEWTDSFQKGITSENFSGKTVYEVGLGTGANAIHLLNIGAEKVYGSDLEGRNPLLAGTNINENLGIDGFSKFEAFLGEESLLSPLKKEENLEKREEIKEIIACIPQAILPQGAEKHPDDKAHYYPEEYFDEYEFNKYALGLNEALLKESKELTPNANITLNLGGRVGKEKLFQLFKKYNYIPEITHTEIIPQCPTTNLSFWDN